MSEENEDTSSDDLHPTIIDTEDIEILERKPPNDQIISYNLVGKKEEEKTSENNNKNNE